jgi:hypothetical protein
VRELSALGTSFLDTILANKKTNTHLTKTQQTQT